MISCCFHTRFDISSFRALSHFELTFRNFRTIIIPRTESMLVAWFTLRVRRRGANGLHMESRSARTTRFAFRLALQSGLQVPPNQIFDSRCKCSTGAFATDRITHRSAFTQNLVQVPTSTAWFTFRRPPSVIENETECSVGTISAHEGLVFSTGCFDELARAASPAAFTVLIICIQHRIADFAGGIVSYVTSG